MNWTIKEATVKSFHHYSNNQLRTHLAGFMGDYNFTRRFKVEPPAKCLQIMQSAQPRERSITEFER